MSNYTYHGTRDLIAMPGRSVQTYPSGLVRVERSFACRKVDAAKYRNVFRVNEPMPFDDGAPSLDGIVIFPEPQETVRDDGFVEFRVTAYGRISPPPTQGDYTLRSSALISVVLATSVFNSSTGTTANTSISARAIADVFTIKRTLPPSASTADIAIVPESLEPEISFITTPFEIETYTIQKRSYLSQLSSVNFGTFSEFTYTYETFASGFRSRTI
jgi:hypothetical protein